MTAGAPHRDADKAWRRFADACLILDLEVGYDDSIKAVGALRGTNKLEIPHVASSGSAIRQLESFAEGAEFVVGHNIVAHDRVFVEKHLPGSALLDLPVVDSLYVAPLAKPQVPYHHLVKDYKIVGAEQSDPLADCLLTQRLLGDCREALEEWEKRKPWLLSFYRACFDDSDGEGGTSDLKLYGTGRFLGALGGRKLRKDQLLAGFVHFAGGRACSAAARRELPSLLDSPETRPAVAYALAWIMVAGTGSVLPRWVHHRFPKGFPVHQRLTGHAVR